MTGGIRSAGFRAARPAGLIAFRPRDSGRRAGREGRESGAARRRFLGEVSSAPPALRRRPTVAVAPPGTPDRSSRAPQCVVRFGGDAVQADLHAHASLREAGRRPRVDEQAVREQTHRQASRPGPGDDAEEVRAQHRFAARQHEGAHPHGGRLVDQAADLERRELVGSRRTGIRGAVPAGELAGARELEVQAVGRSAILSRAGGPAAARSPLGLVRTFGMGSSLPKRCHAPIDKSY